jgi:anti-sigma regulatory factor (Ser/Thr protein kinase)
MADARTPGAPSKSRTDLDRPDDVALDRPFGAGGLYALRAAVAAHASALGGGTAQVESLVIVASELATNAILHGGGGGRLLLWRADGWIAMRVSDHGTGLPDPETAGTSPQSPSATGGRGLWITRNLCDEMAISAGATGTTVTVSLRLPADAPQPR